jgi:hypothetical protein
MNVTLNPLSPLPDALRQPCRNGSGRRQRIGDYQIDRDALQQFNELLERLDLKHPPLDCDQVASAARQLVEAPRPGRAPPCIQQRMRRAASIDWMLTDPDWNITVAVSAMAAAMVVEYLRGNQTLIPNGLPVVGRLDDAIVIEASWPAVALEVDNYLDFCRVRHIEAGLRGEPERHFGFGRADWVVAARAESQWIAHCRRVGGLSYVPAESAGRFRVN